MIYSKLQIADAIHTYVNMRKSYIAWKRQVEHDKVLRSEPAFMECKTELKNKEAELQQMAMNLGMDEWDATQGAAALGFLDGFLAGLGCLPAYRAQRTLGETPQSINPMGVDYYEEDYV